MKKENARQIFFNKKILHIPVNWASRMHHQNCALQCSGIDSHGMAFHCSPSQNTEGLYVHSKAFQFFFAKPFTDKLMRALFLAKVLKAAHSCELIHWYGGANIFSLPIDITLLRPLANKKCFVQWQGSDIRDPIVESDTNPYYKKATEHIPFKDKLKISKSTQVKQHLFHEAGFQNIAPIDLEDHLIDKTKQSGWYRIQHAIDCQNLVPIIKDASSTIRIGHAPSQKLIKGTSWIEDTIHRLKGKYSIEFTVIHGLSRKESLQRIAECDIFIDQMVLGMYGAASLEAMALGVPTVCYISDTNKARLPADIPIINTTIETLEDTLTELIDKKDTLQKIGLASRDYVTRTHSYMNISNILTSIYTNNAKLQKKD